MLITAWNLGLSDSLQVRIKWSAHNLLWDVGAGVQSAASSSSSSSGPSFENSNISRKEDNMSSEAELELGMCGINDIWEDSLMKKAHVSRYG